MPDRENIPIVPEFLQTEEQGLHARVAELESLLQQCQRDAAVLRHRVRGLEMLESAVLDMAVSLDDSLPERILESAVRLLGASDAMLDLGERGRFSHGAAACGARHEPSSTAEPEPSAGPVLAAPILLQGGTQGTIRIWHEVQDRAFSVDDRELLSAFAEHAVVALNKQQQFARALEELADCRLREQRSKERHLYLERLLACTPDAIITLDAEHRVLEWNPGAEVLFGYTEGEAKGKDLDGLIASPDPAMLEEAIGLTRTVLDGKPVPPKEAVRFRKDGTPVDVMLAGSPIVVDKGLVGTVAVYTDITERKRAEKGLARHAREMAALYETSLEINSQPDLSTLLSAIVRRATELVEARKGSIYLLEEHANSLELVVLHNLPTNYVGLRLREGEGLAGQVVQAGEPMMIADYSQWEGKTAVWASESFRRKLGVPLKVGDRVIGAITVADDEQTGHFDEDDVRLVCLFADQAAIAVENARLLEAEREQRELAEALGQATAAVSSTLDLEEILDLILEQVARAIPHDAISIMLVEDDTARVVRSRGYDCFGQGLGEPALSMSDSPILRQIAETGESVVISDTAQDSDWIREPTMDWIRSYAAAPIHVLDQVVGFLCLDSARPGFFTEVHAETLRAFADQASLALSNAQLFGTVERAKHDWEETFDAMQDPVAVVDRDHRIVRANQAFARLIQKPFANFVGSSYHVVMAAATCPESICPLRQETRGGKTATCVHEYRGRIFEVQATAVSEDTADKSDTTARKIYAFRDITERRRAEEEIRRRNRELVLLNRIIAKSAASPALESFLESVCKELAQAFGASQSVATIFSQDKAESMIVAGCSSSGDNHYRGRTMPIERDPYSQQVLRHRSPLYLEDVYANLRRSPSDGQRARRGTASSLLLPLLVDGEIEGSIRMDAAASRTFTSGEIDLAHRIADQVSTALARIRLEEAQRRLTAAVEQAAEGVMITDTEGNILYSNPAFELITGQRRGQVSSRHARALVQIAPDPAVRSDMWQAVTSGQTWQGRFTSEGQDGNTYSVDSTVSPVRNQVGDVVNYVATLRDMTREVELEKQFQQAQKMEALGRLAGGIAHDFNNLLTVIHLSTRLLEKGLRRPDPLWDHVQHIREAGDRAARLTRQLLSFSRREVVEPKALRLNQVVEDLSRMLKRIIGEDIELVTSLSEDLWPIRADAGQIEQVLMNLVVNARDAMPGGGTLTVGTSNVTLDEEYADFHVDAQPGEHVMLAVCDTGQGMDQEVMAHLFEPFFTTKEQGQGTGLGLSTVFGIVRINGGHIRVESSVQEGTHFYIYLPRLVEMEAEEPWAAYMPDSALATECEGTVLVVEDDAGVRDLAVRVLESYGYQVLHAGCGPDALLLSEQYDGPIDLLLTDVVMPHMNGRELAEQIRAQRPAIPVLYMSGYADSNLLRRGTLPAGMAFLSKPFVVEELIQKVRLLLEIDG
jgi:PAS domain S-box-containing protein